MAVEIYVDGTPLTALAWWGDLEVTHTWPLGFAEASWSMPLEPWQRYRQLKAGNPVEIRVGSWPIAAGDFADINWDEGTMAALGACRQGEEAVCLDVAGDVTSVPDTAIDEAITRGEVTWSRPASISSAPLAPTDTTDQLPYLAALLDAYATSVNKRWWVDPWRRVRIDPDPTVPSFYVIPDSGVLGVATEKQAGTVYGRYDDSTTGDYRTVRYPLIGGGRPAVTMSLVEQGPMTSATAFARCQAVWSQLQAKPGWTNGLTLTYGQLLTPGGQPAPLWMCRAGHMIRLLGVRDERGLSMSTDVVIGESVWSASEGTLQLKPVATAPRDLAAILGEAA